ncbi:MAG: DEAD/DEAH box helicase, partial [Clostridiales bacterium]|nr:DEAD/DEAH box helicase [Clostridiales bacterium]
MKDTFMLSAELSHAIEEMGYEEPTPIQLQAIPPLLEGRDLIGQAQTGTGKTAAFGLPLIERIDPTRRVVQALVLCPTRELALQVAGELVKFSRFRPGVRVLPVYGGQPIERQLRALQMGVQVVVGTPGRVMDHMRRGSLDLNSLNMAVLDEADEMLDMGFRDDIEEILKQAPQERQTALFSATMPRPILALAQRYLVDPVHVVIARSEMTVERIDQAYFHVRSFHKAELLSRLLIRDAVSLALVFCNTKRGVEDVVTDLTRRGFSVAGLHGDMRQIERDAIMARFRGGLVSVLVATDVAARGLDVDNISAVFNYDLPQDVEQYVHRVGRTGRAGREGRAYSFVAAGEMARMWEYRRLTGARILLEKPPTAEDVRAAQATSVIEKVREHAVGEPGEDTLRLADQLTESVEPREAVAALLSLLTEQSGTRFDAAIDLTPPDPARA